MAAQLRIITGPLAAANTARLLARAVEAADAAPGSALWLVPTRRAAQALRPRLGTAPLIATVQQFADETVRQGDPAARPVSLAQRRVIVEDLAAELRSRLSHYQGIAEARCFAELVLGTFAELKQNQITPTAFAAAAAETPEQQLAELYAAYHRHLRRHNLYDPEGRVWYAGQLLGDGRRAPWGQVRSVFVDGFHDLTRAQQELLAAVAGCAEESWITLPDEPSEDRAELWTRPRATLGSLQWPVETAENENSREQPRGLHHLHVNLFRPRKAIERISTADGILAIEAPGLVGEARMAAREIRNLLDSGWPPDEILVTVRDLAPYADLLREVFADYGIPVDVEGADPLHRTPAVALLLRALRLPEENWPFAAVTALLRSGYFRPPWPPVEADPAVAQHSEALLRLLGKPHGRESYLGAVRHWAEKVHPGLEDEQAEESRRRRTHELACRCGAFLERFFRAWDDVPTRGTPAEMIAWLWRFADDLGIRAAAEAGESAALEKLAEELEHWGRLRGSRTLDRAQFFRVLGSLAAEAGLARTARGPGRVRVLSAELACGLEADAVFLLGLGERSFPDLTPPESLLDDAQRNRLAAAGLPIEAHADRFPDEMLLFYRLVTAARRLLVVSYPAVDEKGQRLLPSSFLATLTDCFGPQAIERRCRRMLIEGLDADEPLSRAELRVRLARAGLEEFHGDLPVAVLANLRAARQLVNQRFHHRDFSRYDGWLRDPAVVADLQQRFGPGCILSPTALENYIACPFKFLMRHVLSLEPLDEPSEEIESTARGLAFHRALSRLHTQLSAAGVHHPDGVPDDALLAQLDQAVEELATRASLAGGVLWKLEGQRLKRFGRRYRAHWHKFIEPWLERGVQPRPLFFEAAFGLPPEDGKTPHGPLVISVDGVEVRISGRIDRVDVAELPDDQGLGFWVIDYKTGRSTSFTGADLVNFRRLQLTLYALATQEVLLRDQPARPLGLAYWLVVESGAKMALPGHPRKAVAWFDEINAWPKVRDVLRQWVVRLVTGIRQGEFPLRPREDDCTGTCDYSQVCRISQSRSTVKDKTWHLPLPIVS